MLYLSREEVSNLITHELAISACEEGLKLEGEGKVWSVPRITHRLDKLFIRFMPSAAAGFVGLRVYGRSIIYLLWDGKDGTPLAMMDALAIRDVRTGAVGAIGAKYLARANASRVAVLGSGAVSRNGLIALSKVRKLSHVNVFSPTKEHRDDFAKSLGKQLGVDITAVERPEDAVKNTDVIVTGSGGRGGEPVLRGSWLKPGMFVMGIGSLNELDDEAVTKSTKVVIDSKAQFTYEAKDVTTQVNNGLISWDNVAELNEVLTGKRPGRQNEDEITLLKTTGTAVQDLLPAIRIYKKALELGVGKEMGDLFPISHGQWANVL